MKRRWHIETPKGTYKVRATDQYEAQREIKRKYGKNVLITRTERR